MSRSAARAGMTLIEVLLAIAILVTGLVAVFALINSGVQSHRRAIHETEAINLASAVLADVRAEFFRGLEPHSTTQGVFLQSKDFPDSEYNTLVIPLEPARGHTVTGATDREYFVRVQVRWSQQGNNKSITVQTIMFRKRP